MTDYQIALLESLEKHQAFDEGSAVLFGAIKDKAKLPVSLTELTGCRNAKLIETIKKGDMKYYHLSKKGIQFLNESRPEVTLSPLDKLDLEEAPAIDKAPQIEPMPTTVSNYDADLSRENATLRNALEHEKGRVKALEQNARELNSRIAALESHQELISEKGLLEQIADLEHKLASIKSAETFYTVNTGTTVLTFNDEEKAIESAHNEAHRNNTESTVEKIYRIKYGVAKPVKSTVWEAL